MSQQNQKRSPAFSEQIRFDPFRSPDWRWLRAEWHLAGDRRFSPARDDAATGRAVRFAHAWRHCQTRRQFLGLRRRDPALFAAHEIYRSNGRLRLEIEARLLAAQQFAEVAASTSLPTETIEAFESTFFAVADYLKCRDWIVSRVLGAHRQVQPADEDFATVVKSIAYWHGPTVLDAVLRHVVDPDGRFTIAGATDWSTPEGRLAARIAILVMSHQRSTTSCLISELSRASELIARLERRQDADPMLNRAFTLPDELLTVPPARFTGSLVNDTTCLARIAAEGKQVA